MVKNWDKYRNSDKVRNVKEPTFGHNNFKFSLALSSLLKYKVLELCLLFWRIVIHVCILYLSVFQLVKRVYKGIPLQLRGQAWALLLDIEKVKEENKGKYEVCILNLATTKICWLVFLYLCAFRFIQKMKRQARSTSTEIKQIDLDVNRTFRNHIMFMDRFGVK